MVSENKSCSYQLEFPQLKLHPQWNVASLILKRIQDQGDEALIAGGAVRDLLMGRMPGDLDVASSATPEKIEELFQGQTIAVGKAFGVIRVVLEGHSIEVATYRHDVGSADGRRPEKVVFTNRTEDAKRRDFTINALFYDPFTMTVYDDVDGKKDIDQKILKCVGDSGQRFFEDELRRLRLVRFVSQLGFKIEAQTYAALKVGIEGIQKVSRERITEEIGKMWQGSGLPEAFKIFLETGLGAQVDPAWDRSLAVASEAIWKMPRQEKCVAWAHYFSFFFEENSLRTHFKIFRLPKEIEKFIEAVHQNYKSMPLFLKARLGEQRFQASQLGFDLGFEYYALKSGDTDPLIPKLLKQFTNQEVLPEPLIKAHHIQDQFQGALLGQMLKQLYIEQLDQEWKTSEQALLWLRNQPRKVISN